MLLWLDDAICLYQSGARFQRYIPNVDWEAMDRTLGMTRVGAHLVRSRSQEIPVASESVESQASTIVRSVLNISEDDFDVNMPLTSYGLDSLSASRLSYVKCFHFILTFSHKHTVLPCDPSWRSLNSNCLPTHPWQTSSVKFRSYR
jgi:hypothetical protein